MTPARLLARTLGAGAAMGVGVTAYAVWEARAYTLRSVEVPMLPAGAAPLRVLHLSDLHLTPGQAGKREWVRSLADLEPDLVVNTGDSIAHAEALPSLLEALGPLLDVPGVFVLGSNDYFAPVLRNPLGYLLPVDGTKIVHTSKLPWREMVDAYTAAGWVDLTNTRASSSVRDLTVAWAGVDDPHLRYDDLAAVAGPADAEADLRLAVAHAPYRRVLDQFASDGYDAIFAGHTHGGQIALPLWGALVTNCDLEPARAKGLHRHPADSRPGDAGSAWLHVSAGLGTSPYFPIRTACRPE
ncbi:MAG TPA: metallophosphoesterase, partial [Nocardioides sp.]|nr:metallophosphoesterase [Nocardioides sp.]